MTIRQFLSIVAENTSEPYLCSKGSSSRLVTIVLLNNRLKILDSDKSKQPFWSLVGMGEDARFAVEKRANKDVVYVGCGQ